MAGIFILVIFFIISNEFSTSASRKVNPAGALPGRWIPTEGAPYGIVSITKDNTMRMDGARPVKFKVSGQRIIWEGRFGSELSITFKVANGFLYLDGYEYCRA